MNKLVKWLLAGLAAIVVLWLAQQVILKPVVEIVATRTVGARVTLGTFSLNLFTHKLRITDLHVYNEEGFPPQIFFNASEILVDTDLGSALKGQLHFPLIIFRLNKMTVYKNAQGKFNVNELKIVQEKLHEKTKGPLPNFKIDELRLNIEQVIVEDDSQTPPLIEAYNLNLKDKTIRDINGVPKLIGAVMFEALKPTAIQGAGLYAATTLMGVAFLPGLAIGLAVASDQAVSDMPFAVDHVFRQSLELVKRLGKVKKTDEAAGKIWGTVYGCDISIDVQKTGWGQSKIIIKARKYFFPKPQIAAGLLYQLKEGAK